jgi:hypothetical protein
MRILYRTVGTLVLSCLIAGCGSGGGESSLTPEQEKSPTAGLDALNKMGPMPTAKDAKIKVAPGKEAKTGSPKN